MKTKEGHTISQYLFSGKHGLVARCVFALGILVFGPFHLVCPSDVHASTYTASITTNASIELNLIPKASEDSILVGEDNITVSTTCPVGYNVSIRGSSSTTNLYLDGDGNNNTDNGYSVISE